MDKVKIIVEVKTGVTWKRISFQNMVPEMIVRFRDPFTGEIVEKEPVAFPGCTEFKVAGSPEPFTEESNPNTEWHVAVEGIERIKEEVA